MKRAIIIPIYLNPKSPEALHALEGLRLAKRAIGSLNQLKDQDFTLILPVCLDLAGEAKESDFSEADRFVRDEVRRLRPERTLIVSSHQLKSLRDYFYHKNFKDLSLLIDLKGFSKIRNTGLLLAQALSLEVAIFVDSDELIEDSAYLKIACEYLVHKWNGKEVVGKGGFYMNPDGSILLPSQSLWWKVLWNKTKWMNQVWHRILSSKERLVPSPMLLGGNVALHHTLFCSIPFDPYIPRGEDTDYLINASQKGFCLLFDKQMVVKHLHPGRDEVYFQAELRWDIERFLYERKKIKGGVNINLDPYPGYFLKWTLYPKAFITSLLLSLHHLKKGQGRRARECIANISLFFRERNGSWLNYLKFRADWERMMTHLRRERMSNLLKGCWI